MTPPSEPMTFDELSELYRIEMKSNSISQARPDLFRAMADLESRLRNEFDKQMSIDPESVMCEGANQHRKKAELLVKNILHIRTQKICQMAIRGAMGADNDLSTLTSEEKEYYTEVQTLSRRHLLEVDRLRGRKVTVATHIDEPPVHEIRHEEPVHEEPAAAEMVHEEPVPENLDQPEEAIPPMDDSFDDFPPESFDDMDEPEFAPKPEHAPVKKEEPAVEVREPETREPAAEEPVSTVPDTPIETFEEPSDDDLSTVVLRILDDLPTFVGPDRDYNLRKEDIVTMPRVMADALVNVEKAVVVRPSP